MIALGPTAVLSLSFQTLNRLSHATRAHHADADAPWLALTRSQVQREDYVRHLALTYGFEAPLEGAFAYTVGLADVICLRDRVRAGLLAEDLLALGLRPSALSHLPQCFSIMPFPDIAEALGWMYVVERATLLHDAIRRSLLRQLPEASCATAYLRAAGSTAGARWQRFGIALDNYTTSDEIAERIVSAADHAFRRWRDWLDVNELEQRCGA